jgi:hypothetical protein
MGAAMFLANGGEHVRFSYRKFEGVNSTEEVIPEWLVLDGQQRLTTLYQVLKSKGATVTRLETERDKTIKRYYYLDIKKCLDPNTDRLDAIISVSEKKQLTANIGRDILLDLYTKEKEFENLMFPLNITFSPNDTDDWRYEMEEYLGTTGNTACCSENSRKRFYAPSLPITCQLFSLTKKRPKRLYVRFSRMSILVVFP